MAAAHKNSSLRSLPILHGMLRVSGESIEGPRPSDLFDVFVDDAGDLVLVMLDVRGAAESSGSFLSSMMRQTRTALETQEPLHQVVSELEMQLAVRPGVEAGLLILRLSQSEAKVELLNAGMPPIATTPPGGELSLHPALSGPVGRRVGEVHPYEVVPLIWGSAWLAVSDGMTGGSLDAGVLRELCAKLQFADRGMSLAAASSETLYDVLQDVLPAARFLRDDATCVFVGADVHQAGGRFQSGIESASH
ncbi:MAG TPA: SpoIIE family protein phosphatase [Polyangiaceae bacterium]|nr:SpoIIE family protein phosphatase [Polyangiaceae bacterium]